MGPSSDEQHEEMLIPTFLACVIMGQHSEMIQRIRIDSGARTVQFGPCSFSPKDKILHIVGEEEAVRRAKSTVEELMESTMRDSVHEELIVPHERCGVVVGAGGERLARLRVEFGLKVALVDNIFEPRPDGKVMHLVGSAAAIQAAKGKIATYIDPSTAAAAERLPPVRVVDLAREQVAVPAHARGKVIGAGGATIKRVRHESGATVQFAADSPPYGDALLDVFGARENVELAKRLVQEIIDTCPRQLDPFGAAGAVTTHFAMPREIVSVLVGRSADMFRSVLCSNGVRLHINPNELLGQSSILYVSITGNELQRGQAMAHLNQLIHDNSHLLASMFYPPPTPNPAVAAVNLASPPSTVPRSSADNAEATGPHPKCHLESPPIPPPPLIDENSNADGMDDRINEGESMAALAVAAQPPAEQAAAMEGSTGETETNQLAPNKDPTEEGIDAGLSPVPSEALPTDRDDGGTAAEDTEQSTSVHVAAAEEPIRSRKRPHPKVIACITIDDD